MSFEFAVQQVIRHEGGYVNNPSDPGGETKYGICKRSYPDLDIARITIDDASSIYRHDFWDKLPPLPAPLDYLVFDFAVNGGVKRAIKTLQLSVGAKDDGDWGPKSRACLASKRCIEQLIYFQAERARFYALLDDLDDTFARGWMRRVMESFYIALNALGK